MQSLYDVLGVLETATPGEIKAAHRRKIRTMHPDTGGSEEAAKQVNAAYEILSDPIQRAEYDRSRREQSLVCPLCDESVLTDDDLMEHIIRHRAEVAAAQRVVHDRERGAEADRVRRARAEAQRTASRSNASATAASRAAPQPHRTTEQPRPQPPHEGSYRSRLLLAASVLLALAAIGVAVTGIPDIGLPSTRPTSGESEFDAQIEKARLDAETTTTTPSTTTSTRPTTTASEGFDGATDLNPFMAKASASELLFGQPTEAWGDERGIVSDALVSVWLVWTGPDEDNWQIFADGKPTELWISGGWGCVDDSCRKKMTSATYGSNSDRHVWWIDLGNQMRASVALGFELQSGETHSLGCWSTTYRAPAVSTVAGTANGSIERAWIYADGNEGLTWYPVEAAAIDPTNEPGEGQLYRC